MNDWVDDDELRAFATQQVEVTAIEYLPGRYRRRSTGVPSRSRPGLRL